LADRKNRALENVAQAGLRDKYLRGATIDCVKVVSRCFPFFFFFFFFSFFVSYSCRFEW